MQRGKGTQNGKSAKGGGKGKKGRGEKGKNSQDKGQLDVASGNTDDTNDDDSSDMEDMSHFADVCFSLMSYAEDAGNEVRWVEEAIENVQDPFDKELLMPSVISTLVMDMKRCVDANATFLANLVLSDEDARSQIGLNGLGQVPDTHVVQERNSSKTRTVLRQFVRDWAAEGAKERTTQYGTLVSALQRYVPRNESKTGKRPRVLAPGCGLARLPFEVARLGYDVEGNEFSYHMLQGSKWVLNETSQSEVCTIFPFVLGLEHRRGANDHLRGIKVPDVCPSFELCPNGEKGADLSMCAGEFVEVYQSQESAWNAVLTCFFIDTAKNIFLYIRTIAHIIKPGGLWANIGPLLYHYAEQPDAISIELSWEEVKPAIEKYFIFREEEIREAHYTTNVHGMFHTRYRCKYFAAIRNDVPASGYSHPVFGSG